MKPSSESALANSRIPTPEYNMRRNLVHLNMIMLLSWAVIMMNADLCSAVEHVVGGDRGWAPKSDIHGWASRQTFYVGDNLWFAYASGEQNVIELKSQEELEACNISNPISIYNAGLDSVPLLHVGTRYFTCKRVEDCQNGMKLHINVHAAPSSSESQTWSEAHVGILGNLFSREILQKLAEWSLPWPAIEEFSTFMGGVKAVAEPPTSESPLMFATRSVFSSILLSVFILWLY